jgi:tRNA:m4X modification enzyme
MKEHNLINSNFAYIEYGAGKGRFSHQIAETLKYMNSTAVHVLIEREPRKLKYDRFHRENKFFIRCKMDIRDFNLKTLK